MRIISMSKYLDAAKAARDEHNRERHDGAPAACLNPLYTEPCYKLFFDVVCPECDGERTDDA